MTAALQILSREDTVMVKVKTVSIVLAVAALTGCGSPELRKDGEASSHPLVSGDSQTAGRVVIFADDENLYIEFFPAPGFELRVAEACVAAVPFEWVDPATCPYRRSETVSGDQKISISAPLVHFGEHLEAGDMLFLQVHTGVVAPDKVEIDGGAYGESFKGRIGYAVEF